jgi:hypothetical protein
MDLSKLSPEDQNVLAQLFQKAQAATPEGASVEGTPVDLGGAKPGQFKDDPEGAKKHIGMLLARNAKGQLGTKEPHWYGPAALFGAKQFQPLADQNNYFPAAKEANLERFLPPDLPQTPEGISFLDNKGLDNARQLAATRGAGVNVGDLREQIYVKAPMLKGMLKAEITDPNQAATLVQTFGDKTRASFYQPKGFDAESMLPVSYDQANNQWYKGDEPVPANQITRLLSSTLKNVPAAEMNRLNLLNTRMSQIQGFKDTFDPKSWGLINGSLQKTIAFYTDSNPERAAQYKNMYDIVADIVHERYGANLTSNELSQKVDSIMSKYQSPTAIQAFIKIQEARAKTEKNHRVKALKSQQYMGVDELEQGGESEFPTAPAPKATSKKPKKDPLGLF